jgi:hypothetical protein
VRALFEPNVDGQRIALTNEVVSISTIFNIIKARFPNIQVNEKKVSAEDLMATNNTHIQLYARNMGKRYVIDNYKSKKLLKMEYIPFEKTFVDMVEQMIRIGTVKVKYIQ